MSIVQRCTVEDYMDEYLPLRDVVFNTLRKEILIGKLQSGDRLMELHLADRLGVSRTPIREAIRKLELEGLVTMIPRRGAVVAQISSKGLKDVLEVRQALDALAIELACDRITSEELDDLRKACDRFAEVTKTKDAVQIAEADVELHDIIVRSTRNERLGQLVENLSQQMYRYRLEYIKDENHHNRLIAEHEEIYRCIAQKDKAAGAEAIRMHIYNQEQSVLNQIYARSGKGQKL